MLQEKNFHMSNSSDKRAVDTKFAVPKAVQRNGTLWGHFYVGLSGSNLDPRQPGYDTAKAYHFAYPLTQYLPKKRIAKTRNLLDARVAQDEAEVDEEPSLGPVFASHYHPNASFSFVPAVGVKDFTQMHPAVKHFLQLEATGARDGSGENGWYCAQNQSFPFTLAPVPWANCAQIPSCSSTTFGSLLAT